MAVTKLTQELKNSADQHISKVTLTTSMKRKKQKEHHSETFLPVSLILFIHEPLQSALVTKIIGDVCTYMNAMLWLSLNTILNVSFPILNIHVKNERLWKKKTQM